MEETEWIWAAYAVSGADGDRMELLLKGNGIPVKRQGGTRDIYTIKSVYGEEILVQEKDLERAREILRKYHVPAAAVGKRRLEDDGRKEPKKGINLRAVISWLIVAAVLLAILWPVIQSRL